MTANSRLLAVVVAAWVTSAGAAFAQIPTGDPAGLFHDDVHAKAGLTCETCHGKTAAGQPAPIKRTAIAPLCARCHSDAGYMQRFTPKPAIDQYAQYQTSTHGKQMAKGETRVATCSDCHGAHGVRARADAKSPVAPAHVTATCARCHSDEEKMAAFRHPDAPAEWKHSVHGAAFEHGDTSSPTCVTCHSSHGTLPAGSARLEEVCWQCHVREATFYKASPKKKIFEDTEHPGCVTCHESHKIEKPSDSYVDIKGDAVCATCHDADMKGAAEIALVKNGLQELTTGIARAGLALDHAERVGMLVDDGRQALRDASEQQILARVAVHTFTAKPFTAAADPGIKDAARAEAIAQQALKDLQYRRKGLAVATVLILGFLATLGLTIRRLPPIPPRG